MIIPAATLLLAVLSEAMRRELYRARPLDTRWGGETIDRIESKLVELGLSPTYASLAADLLVEDLINMEPDIAWGPAWRRWHEWEIYPVRPNLEQQAGAQAEIDQFLVELGFPREYSAATAEDISRGLAYGDVLPRWETHSIRGQQLARYLDTLVELGYPAGLAREMTLAMSHEEPIPDIPFEVFDRSTKAIAFTLFQMGLPAVEADQIATGVMRGFGTYEGPSGRWREKKSRTYIHDDVVDEVHAALLRAGLSPSKALQIADLVADRAVKWL